MDYKISQALNDLKNFYGLEDFKEVNLNMVDVTKPFIRFKSGNDNWILRLSKIAEEGENGVL
jgi:hypothetical protein